MRSRPAGLLGDHRDVEVAVDGHRRGARDRRGRHDQHVGHAAFLGGGLLAVAPLSRSAARCSTPKRCCSSTTTTPSERNRTPSSMRAWVPITRSAVPSSKAGGDALPLLGRGAVGEQLDGRAAARRRGCPESSAAGTVKPSEQAADADGVLLGEHLGRRHQRCLVPALHRGEHGGDGNDGLAATPRRPAAGGASGGGRRGRPGSRRWRAAAPP